MTKTNEYRDLSDEEILRKGMSGGVLLGPAIIGQELYDLVCEVKNRTKDGKLGPAIVGERPSATPPGVKLDDYDGIARNTLLKKAREVRNALLEKDGELTAAEAKTLELINVPSTATRDDVAEALFNAGIAPPTD